MRTTLKFRILFCKVTSGSGGSFPLSCLFQEAAHPSLEKEEVEHQSALEHIMRELNWAPGEAKVLQHFSACPGKPEKQHINTYLGASTRCASRSTKEQTLPSPSFFKKTQAISFYSRQLRSVRTKPIAF